MRRAAIATAALLLLAATGAAHAQTLSEPTSAGALIVELTPEPASPDPGEVTLGINFVNPASMETQVHIDYAVDVTMGETVYASVERSHTSEGRVSIPVELADEGTYGVKVTADGIFFQPIEAQSAEFSLQVGGGEAPSPAPEPARPGGGCLIATAAYGTELAPQVQSLRELRDGTVMETGAGRAFMGAFNTVYYAVSPAIADMERQSPALRSAVAAAIAPMLATLGLLEGAPIDGDASMLAYGLAVIALNAGIYAGAPALAVMGARRLAARRA
ncbi:MAG: copper-binding protein [Thaumarchaeota archaeon]|nr:copper-binding protein [Nitrososphaerota archaeon]